MVRFGRRHPQDGSESRASKTDMRTKTVKRHYCDFCNKGMFRAKDMVRHELGCTKNPARTCYLCQNSTALKYVTLIRTLIEEYADADTSLITDEDLRRIRDATGDCPSCILSIMRLSGLYGYDKFDYKAELIAWNQEQREAHSEF